MPLLAGPAALDTYNWTFGAFLALESFHPLPNFWGQRLDVLAPLVWCTLPIGSRSVHVEYALVYARAGASYPFI